MTRKILTLLCICAWANLSVPIATASQPTVFSWFDGDRPHWLQLDHGYADSATGSGQPIIHLHDQHGRHYQLDDKLLVHFRSERSAEAAANWAGKHRLTAIKPLGLSNAWQFRCESGIGCMALSRSLYDQPEVRYAYPDFIRPRSTRSLTDSREPTATIPGQTPWEVPFVPDHPFIPDDPLFSAQWHLLNTGQGSGLIGQDVDILTAWDKYTGSGVDIAVVDDGLMIAHEDLTDNTVADRSWDYVADESNPDGGSGHGTKVAGVAAATGGNNLGVTGAAPAAGLVGLRLLGASTDANEADALTRDPADNHIYSNSWGPTDGGANLEGPGPLTLAALHSGVAQGRDGRGSIYVWAGGNGGNSDNANYDGYTNSRFTISVAASTNQGKPAWYSEAGANHLVTAPSSGGTLNITTTAVNSSYSSSFTGTSSAAPLVAGVIALMLEANPNLGWRDVQQILASTADHIDPGDTDWSLNDAGHWINHKYGFGQINATAAVNTATAWLDVAAEVSLTGQLSPDLPIPDNDNTGISSSLQIPGNIRIESADLVFTSEHAKWGDLEIILTSPVGTESVLSQSHSNGNGNQYATGWRFNSMRLLNEASTGEWTLTVRDKVSGNTGNLQQWKLSLYGTVHATHGCEGDPLNNLPDLKQNTSCVSTSSIDADNRISNSAMVQYSAPIVRLWTGFSVESGSEFLIIN